MCVYAVSVFVPVHVGQHKSSHTSGFDSNSVDNINKINKMNNNLRLMRDATLEEDNKIITLIDAAWNTSRISQNHVSAFSLHKAT